MCVQVAMEAQSRDWAREGVKKGLLKEVNSAKWELGAEEGGGRFAFSEHILCEALQVLTSFGTSLDWDLEEFNYFPFTAG